jgi:solute carrier family 10 (sodium/bile acid cotransporter), member 7
MSAFLLRHWFLIGLAVVIPLAALLPWLGAPGGPLKPELTVHMAVAGAFLVSGLTLPLARLREAAGQVRLHLFIQLFCFVLIPALVWSARPLLAAVGASDALIGGFVVLACLPTTIASCVIFTRAAGGNEAGALCNSVLGNLAGLVLTPALLLLLLGTHGEAPISNVLRQLSLEVLLPLVVGQGIRLSTGRHSAVFERVRQIPSALLLYLIFCVFCATFSAGMPPGAGLDIAIAVVGSVVLHGVLLTSSWWLGGLHVMGFSRGDRIAALLCSTQKTIALGIPMLSILYGHHPRLAWLTLPLICYHPLQLVVSGVLAARLRQGR